ncbi:MAG: toprim domain-containing protein [Chitinophagaceae bacterium]|nr:toprim domain-containing protein [Chitinophagaceae bacterium]
MISNIDEIKQAADIVEIISGYVELKPKSGNHVGLCPFHKEKTPSFTVSNAKGFKCFGCGKSGDAIAFVMEHLNINYIQAIELIAEKYNIPIQETLPQQQKYNKPQPRLEKLNQDTIKYFETRGISNNTLLRFGITEAIEWMPKAGQDVRVICFNYFKDDQLVNIKFRAKDKDFKLLKGAELIFYNLDGIKDEQEVIIVEGEVDCLTMYECGFYNVVSVPNGAGTGQQQLKYLDNCWKFFEDKTKIILFTDNDEPGRSLQAELARRLGKDRCYKVDYPESCKDANDVFLKHSKAMVSSIIEQAKRWPIDGILTMDDVYADVKDYYLNGYPKGADAGIGEFDELLTFSGGQMTVVTGSPNMGKSEFIDYIVTSLAVDVTIHGLIDKFKEVVLRTGVKGIVIDPWNYLEHKVPPGYSETQYISEALTLIKEFALHTDTHVFIVAHPRKLQKDQTGQYPPATMYDISGSAHFFNKTDNGISVHRDFTDNSVKIFVQKVRFSWLGKIGYTAYNYDTFTRKYISI